MSHKIKLNVETFTPGDLSLQPIAAMRAYELSIASCRACRFVDLKALSYGAIFLATCNAILLLRDVKLAKYMFTSQFAYIFLTYQTFVTNLHLLGAELRSKLQEKLHRATGPLIKVPNANVHNY